MPQRTWRASVGARRILMRNEWSWSGETSAELYVDGELRDRSDVLFANDGRPLLSTVVSTDDGAVYVVRGYARSGLFRVVGKIVIEPAIPSAVRRVRTVRIARGAPARGRQVRA